MKNISEKALAMKISCLKSIKSNARKSRINYGMTLSELSKTTGFTVSALIQFENGKNDSATLLWIYKDFFGLNV